uniref:Uncharacterized protein n=1 Tax=Aegilops tauschii subsp. strangulata TaxID=200361 RepID=A0A453G7C2_AEGTS
MADAAEAINRAATTTAAAVGATTTAAAAGPESTAPDMHQATGPPLSERYHAEAAQLREKFHAMDISRVAVDPTDRRWSSCQRSSARHQVPLHLLHCALPAPRSLPEALPAAVSQILLSTRLCFPCDVAGFTISTTMGVTSPRERVETMAIMLPFLPSLPRSANCGRKPWRRQRSRLSSRRLQLQHRINFEFSVVENTHKIFTRIHELTFQWKKCDVQLALTRLISCLGKGRLRGKWRPRGAWAPWATRTSGGRRCSFVPI